MAQLLPNAPDKLDQPFDIGSETPTIDAGLNTIGLSYDPRTGTFSFGGQGSGGGTGGGVLPSRNPMPPGVGPNTSAMGSLGASAGIGAGAGLGTAAGLAGAGAGAVDALKKGLSLQDILALITGGVGAIGGALQGPPQAETDLNEILKIARDRISAQEPLFKAFTTMAHSQLPRYSREGQ